MRFATDIPGITFAGALYLLSLLALTGWVLGVTELSVVTDTAISEALYLSTVFVAASYVVGRMLQDLIPSWLQRFERFVSRSTRGHRQDGGRHPARRWVSLQLFRRYREDEHFDILTCLGP